MLLFFIRDGLGVNQINVAGENLLVDGEHFYQGKITSADAISIGSDGLTGGFAKYKYGSITLTKGSFVDNEQRVYIQSFIYDYKNNTRIFLDDLIGYYSSSDEDTITFQLFQQYPQDETFEKDTYYSDTFLNVADDLALKLSLNGISIVEGSPCTPSLGTRHVVLLCKKGSSIVGAVDKLAKNCCCTAHKEGNNLFFVSIHGGSRFPIPATISKLFRIKWRGNIVKSITITGSKACDVDIENGARNFISTSKKYTFNAAGSNIVFDTGYEVSPTTPPYVGTYFNFLKRKKVEVECVSDTIYQIGQLVVLKNEGNFSFIITGIDYKATEDSCTLHGIDAMRDPATGTPLECPDWTNPLTIPQSVLIDPVDGSSSSDKNIKVSWSDEGGVPYQVDVVAKSGSTVIAYDSVCGSSATYDMQNNRWRYTTKFSLTPGSYSIRVIVGGCSFNTYRDITVTA